jgi:hypothetical protein
MLKRRKHLWSLNLQVTNFFSLRMQICKKTFLTNFLKNLFAGESHQFVKITVPTTYSSCHFCPSYEIFLLTPYFVHRVDAGPNVLEKGL